MLQSSFAIHSQNDEWLTEWLIAFQHLAHDQIKYGDLDQEGWTVFNTQVRTEEDVSPTTENGILKWASHHEDDARVIQAIQWMNDTLRLPWYKRVLPDKWFDPRDDLIYVSGCM